MSSMPPRGTRSSRPSSPLVPRLTLSLVALATAMAACGGEAALPTPPDASASSSTASPNGAARPDSTRKDSTRTDSVRTDSARVDSTRGTPGAVAGIRLSPRQLVLAVGRAAVASVLPVDANGVPSLAQLARVTFAVADARVAKVDADSGIVTGVAVGSTTLYARVGTMVDSAVVTVIADTTRPAPPPTPGIRIYLRTVTAFTGRTNNVGATVYDAAGRPTRSPGKQATWRIGDERVARLGTPTTASDTAFLVPITGVAPGTTKLYATLDGVTDSVPVTVVTLRDTVTTPPTPPKPAAAFTLTAIVLAPGTPPAGSRDTALSVPYAGARITVYRLVRDSTAPRGTGADSLGTRVQVATGTSDATGQATFRDLPSGYYLMTATPPESAPFLEGNTIFGPPYESAVRYGIFLRARR